MKTTVRRGHIKLIGLICDRFSEFGNVEKMRGTIQTPRFRAIIDLQRHRPMRSFRQEFQKRIAGQDVLDRGQTPKRGQNFGLG